MDDMKTRVRRGVALLDKDFPLWRERVDLGRLEMHDPHTCILGQVLKTSSMPAQAAMLGFTDNELEALTAHGFDIEGDEGYLQLRQEWIEAAGL